MAITSLRRLRLTTDNRAAVVRAFLEELQQAEPSCLDMLATEPGRTEYLFEERNPGGLSVACMQHFGDVLDLAVPALMSGEPAGQARLREAFAYGYWSCELNQQDYANGRFGYDAPDDDLLARLAVHGLAVAGGASETADWLLPYLHNALKGGAMCSFLKADVPFHRFYIYLIEAQLSGRWPTNIDRTALRAYGDVLATVGDAEAFRAALVALCDYRLAQGLGFDGIDAPKRRSSSSVASVFDLLGWLPLLPFELFSLKYVYERVTGNTLDIVADHPLLQTPLMHIPPVLPLYEDDFLRRAIALGEAEWGERWKKRTPVALI